ncbi:hypothetical protein V6N11_024684 [Hibiscus sabdariffa]|uniref:Uncharacterized protein n=1 Tax=Hibiscus sabdariffa TaxID=183260 RepID=A0ABR2QMV8_9ROSI
MSTSVRRPRNVLKPNVGMLRQDGTGGLQRRAKKRQIRGWGPAQPVDRLGRVHLNQHTRPPPIKSKSESSNKRCMLSEFGLGQIIQMSRQTTKNMPRAIPSDHTNARTTVNRERAVRVEGDSADGLTYISVKWGHFYEN